MTLFAVRTTLARSTMMGRRQMSTAPPKLHRAADKWPGLLKERPPKDHLDEHLVFHPPYNGPAVALGIFTCVVIGYGSMAYGMAHQQYKQGYWK